VYVSEVNDIIVSTLPHTRLWNAIVDRFTSAYSLWPLRITLRNLATVSSWWSVSLPAEFSIWLQQFLCSFHALLPLRVHERCFAKDQEALALRLPKGVAAMGLDGRLNHGRSRDSEGDGLDVRTLSPT